MSLKHANMLETVHRKNEYIKGMWLKRKTDTPNIPIRPSNNSSSNFLVGIKIQKKESSTAIQLLPPTLKATVSQNKKTVETPKKIPRYLDVIPGVGSYDLTKYSSFVLKPIQNRSKSLPVLKKLAPVEPTVGAGQYDPKLPILHQGVSFPKANQGSNGRPQLMEYTLNGNSPLSVVFETPAPGAYEVQEKTASHGPKFDKAPRYASCDAESTLVGPGKYDIPSTLSKKSVPFNKAESHEKHLEFNETAIVLQEEDSSEINLLSKKIHETFGKAERMSHQEVEGPGLQYSRVEEWPLKKSKSLLVMKPKMIEFDDQGRFELLQIKNMNDRIWGPL
jgi:Sperm-tail PG-rich repeat